MAGKHRTVTLGKREDLEGYETQVRNLYEEFKKYVPSDALSYMEADKAYIKELKAFEIFKEKFDVQALENLRDAIDDWYDKTIKFIEKNGGNDADQVAEADEKKQAGEILTDDQEQLLLRDFLFRNVSSAKNAFDSFVKTEADKAQKDDVYLAEMAKLNHNVELSAAKSTLAKTAQKPANMSMQSGYGLLYDNLTECVKLIEQSRELTDLAGDSYDSFLEQFSQWKKEVETRVGQDRHAFQHGEYLAALKEKTTSFFETVGKYTNVFDPLKNLIDQETTRYKVMSEAHPNMLLKDVLTNAAPVAEHRENRRDVEDEVLSDDYPTISTKFDDMITTRKHERKLATAIDSYVLSIPYSSEATKKVAWEGEDLKNGLKLLAPYSFGQLQENGNIHTAILAYLDGKGIPHEDLYAFTDEKETAAKKRAQKLIEEARTAVLDTVICTDLQEIDEKASSIMLEEILAYEKKLDALIANPTPEAILKFSAQSGAAVAVLEQGMPHNLYNANGDVMVRGTIDRKLEALGKPYKLDDIVNLLHGINQISKAVKEFVIFETLPVDKQETKKTGYLNSSYMIHAFQSLAGEMKKVGNIADAIRQFGNEQASKSYTENQVMQDDDIRLDWDYGLKVGKASMLETLNWLEIRNPENLLQQMKTQRDANGASTEFTAVLDALEEVIKEEKHGLEQRFINEAYDKLKQATDTYLNSRNPRREPGKERYRLITRIDQMVDASKPERQTEAEKQFIAHEDGVANGKVAEYDWSFQEKVKDFKAVTTSRFGDSAEMTRIKTLADELAFNQTRGMKIPAFDGDVNWYNLYKACADYIANPKKADNERKAAVVNLMSVATARISAAAQQSGNTYDQESAKQLDQIYRLTTDKNNQIPEALSEFEKNRASKLSSLRDAESKRAEAEIIDLKNIESMRSFVDDGMEKPYTDGFFAAKFEPMEIFDKARAYNYGNGNTYTPIDIDLSGKAEEGFKLMGVTEKYFSILAYMQFEVNGHHTQKMVSDKIEDAKVVESLTSGPLTGVEPRENIINTTGVAAYNQARKNIKNMMDKVGGDQKLISVAGLIAKWYVMFGDYLPYENNYGNKYVANKLLIGHIGRMLENDNMANAVLDTGAMTKTDIEYLKGQSRSLEYMQEDLEAKYRVAAVLTNGGTLTEQEMRESYKAILRGGLIFGENQKARHSGGDVIAQRKLSDKIGNLSQEISNIEFPKSNGNQAKAKLTQQDIEKIEKLKAEQTRLMTQLTELSNAPAVLPKLAVYLGGKDGKAEYEKMIDSMIPAHVTEADLRKLVQGECSYSYENEYQQMIQKAGLEEKYKDWTRQKASKDVIDKLDSTVLHGGLKAIQDRKDDLARQEQEKVKKQEEDARKKELEQERIRLERPMTLAENYSGKCKTIADKVAADTYVNGFFAADFKPAAELVESKAYSLGLTTYNPKPIDLKDPDIQKGLQVLKMKEEDFANLAYMDFIQNSYSVGREQKGEQSETVFKQFHENVAGWYLSLYSMHGVSDDGKNFEQARVNAGELLKQVGQSKDITPVVNLVSGMISLMQPGFDFIAVPNDKYVAQRMYFSRIMKMVNQSPNLVQQIKAQGEEAKKKLYQSNGLAKEGDYIRKAAEARLKITAAFTERKELTPDERKECCRAIFKAGLLWGENQTLDNENQKLRSQEYKKKNAVAKERCDAWVTASKNRDAIEKEKVADNEQARQEHAQKLALAESEVKAASDAYSVVSGFEKEVNDKTYVHERPLVTLLGSNGGEKRYEQLLDQLVPDQLTMDQLNKYCDIEYQFKKEYAEVVNLAKKQLESERQNQHQLNKDNIVQQDKEKPENQRRDSIDLLHEEFTQPQ